MNRHMSFRIGLSDSPTFSYLYGVPQGSNLGPQLFSVYMNDMSALLATGNRLFYADDTKLFGSVNSILQKMLRNFVVRKKLLNLDHCEM